MTSTDEIDEYEMGRRSGERAAAAEIERLRAELEATQSTLCSLRCLFEDWKVAHSTMQKDAEIERLQAELAEWRKLKDPTVLHANLLRGQPAQLSKEQLRHLIGGESA